MRLRRAIDNAVGSRAFGAAISSGEGSRRKVRFPTQRRLLRPQRAAILLRDGEFVLKYFLLRKAIRPRVSAKASARSSD